MATLKRVVLVSVVLVAVSVVLVVALSVLVVALAVVPPSPTQGHFHAEWAMCSYLQRVSFGVSSGLNERP